MRDYKLTLTRMGKVVFKLVRRGPHCALDHLAGRWLSSKSLFSVTIFSAIILISQPGLAQEGRVCEETDDSGTPIEKSEAGAHGIAHSGESGPLTIVRDKITVTGDNADGIRIVNHDGDITICSEDSIQVSGDNSDGIHVEKSISLPVNDRKLTRTEISVSDVDLASDGTSLGAISVVETGTLHLTSNGAISTSGDEVYGVIAYLYRRAAAQLEDERSTISINDLTTSGEGAIGILTHNYDALNNKIEIRVNGELSTMGQGSHGIASSGNLADLKVVVSETGMIRVADPGDSETKAIFIKASDPDRIAKVQIENAGKIDGRVYAEACVEPPALVNRGLVFAADRDGNNAIQLVKYAGTLDSCTSTDGRGVFTNEKSGVFSPGGPGTIATSTVAADFRQLASGSMQMDVDWRKMAADLIVIEGTAELAGHIAVLELSSPLLVESGSSIPLVHGKMGLPARDQLNARLSVSDPILVDYSLRKRRATGSEEFLDLHASYNLLHPDLNQNQRNVLAELHHSRTNESVAEVLLDMGRETEIEGLRYDLDSLGNEIFGTVLQTSALANLEFASSLPDCDRAAIYRPVGDLDVSPSTCLWAAPELRRHERRRTWPQRGYSEASTGFAAGVRLWPDNLGVYFDFAGDVDASKIEMQDFATADGSRWQLAAGIGAELGSLGYSIVASASESRQEIHRRLPVSAESQKTVGSQSTKTLGAVATVSGRFEIGNWSISPSLQAGLIKVKGGDYAESGGGDLSLNVSKIEKTVVFLRPGIKAELDETSVSGFQFAPQVGVSLTHAHNGGFVTVNSFKGGLGSFESETSLLSSEVELSLGAKFNSKSNNIFGQVGVSVGFAPTGISNVKFGGGGLTFLF